MLTVYAPPARTTSSRGLFTEEEYAQRRAFFTNRLSPTPLVRLPALAASLGLGAVWVKDETRRFDLPAFKSLGVEFAVDALRRRRGLGRGSTLVCASAGNHGRAVARAARVAGVSARIYLDQDVAAPRVEAIASEGAEIVRVAGTYDDAVRLAAADAARTGSVVISDTSYEGYAAVPHDIMLGYTEVMDEADAAWGPEGPPDVVFVQAGVGGLLAAVASWMLWRHGDARPRLAAVEPARAACVMASARAGAPTAVPGPLTTIMAGLRCGEVSPAAFEAALAIVDAYVAIDDTWCRNAMRQFARPHGDDPALAVGTSGAAGLGAILAVAADADARELLGLTATTRVMAIATEGVTEPALWSEITGLASHR